MNWAVLVVNGTTNGAAIIQKFKEKVAKPPAELPSRSVVPENPIGAEIIELAGLGFSGMFAILLSFCDCPYPKTSSSFQMLNLRA